MTTDDEPNATLADTQVPASGRQHWLHHGRYSACVATVGATLRVLDFEDRPLVLSFDADQVRPDYHGAVLAPWPNRVVDGCYTWAGRSHQLALNEPERGHALHGLVLWTDFSDLESGPSRVALGGRVPPQRGYPFALDVEVSYDLDDDGLTTRVSTTNVGTLPAPYGVAAHPYLCAADGRVDDWRLRLPARKVLAVTSDRLIPQSSVPAAHLGFDFDPGRLIGDTAIDHAFTDIDFDDGGEATASLLAPDGSGVGMSWRHDSPWVQVHTADALGRAGLALEPMTCPPDAFNTHEDLMVLDPGDTAAIEWRIFAVETAKREEHS